MEDKYEKAVAIWISSMTNFKAEDIYNVEFDTIQDGYCDTCSYTTMGITFMVKGKGTREINMQSDAPAQFIREVSDIIQEMDNAE